MLSIFLFYYIGKSFYYIKEQSKKGRWLYVFYGIFSYFLGLVLSILIISIILELVEEGLSDSIHDRAWDLIGMPFGALTCWGAFKYLKRKNERRAISFSESDVLDGGLIEKNLN
jgi:hypothetical protein